MAFPEDNTVTRKRLLYKTKVDYQIGEDGNPVNDYALNHVLGCTHGCRYPCYAQGTAVRSGNVDSYEDWCRPKPVANAFELLDRELASKQDIRRVHMCFTTDPFPYASPALEEETRALNRVIRKMSLSIIEKINAHGIPVTVLTKGVLPSLSDEGKLEYSSESFAPHPDNYYGISLVSLNENFRREYEPNTAPYPERLEALRELHEAGAKTWVSMEPFPALCHAGMMERFGWGYCHVPPSLEEPNIPEGEKYDELEEVLARLAFVDRIVFGRWNYNEEMPTDAADPAAWYDGAAKLVRGFCRAHGIECIVKKGTEASG